MNHNIYISCIVCTYNRARFLRSCLHSFLNQQLDFSFFELIVINNNSTDQTLEIIKDFISILPEGFNFRYYDEYNQGLSYARNRGIVESIGNYLTYIDDDAIVSNDFLGNIYTFISSNPNVIGLGGPIIPYYVDGKPAWMSHYLEGLVSKSYHGETIFEYTGKSFPIGCNMTYLKSALIEIGHFDVSLGRKGESGEASEEKDVFFKLKGKGYSIYYLPNIPVQHTIEKERLAYPYIKKISEGIGRSEKIRVLKIGSSEKNKKTFELIFKFFAALILAFYHFVRLEVSKSKALILFRINVFRGWFSVKNI